MDDEVRRGDAAIRVDETTYDVCLDPGYSIGGPLNGGYLMAVLLRAVVDASPSRAPGDHERPVPARAQARARAGARGAGQDRPHRRDDPGHPDPGRQPFIEAHGHDRDPRATPSPTGRTSPRLAMPPIEECVWLPDPKAESDMTLNAQMELVFDPPTIGWLDGQRPPAGPRPAPTSGWPSRRTPTRTCWPWPWTRCPPVVFSAGDARLGAHGGPHLAPARPARPRLAHPASASGRLISDGWFDEDVEIWDCRGAPGGPVPSAGAGGRVPGLTYVLSVTQSVMGSRIALGLMFGLRGRLAVGKVVSRRLSPSGFSTVASAD